MSDLNMLSPLTEFSMQDHLCVDFNEVKLCELPFMEHFNLRFQPDDQALCNRIQVALGTTIPQQSNSFVIHENVLCAWLGPDEWLIISPLDRAQKVDKEVRAVLADQFATLVNLGSAQTIFRVSGQKAVEYLSRGIAIDLNRPGFNFGACAQTLMAHVNVLVLNHTHDEPMLDLVIRRSFADHLWRWLLDIGEEAEFRL